MGATVPYIDVWWHEVRACFSEEGRERERTKYCRGLVRRPDERESFRGVMSGTSTTDLTTRQAGL